MRTLLIILSLLFISCRSASSPTSTIAKTTTGRSLKWPEYPVKLLPTPEFMDAFGDSFVVATLVWNDQIGHTVFEPGVGNILVETSTTMPENCDTKTACTSLIYSDLSGEISMGLVTVAPDTPKEYIERVLMHELGHVLGLTHDKDEDSLMYPTVHSGPWQIETEDLEAIRHVIKK